MFENTRRTELFSVIQTKPRIFWDIHGSGCWVSSIHLSSYGYRSSFSNFMIWDLLPSVIDVGNQRHLARSSSINPLIPLMFCPKTLRVRHRGRTVSRKISCSTSSCRYLLLRPQLLIWRHVPIRTSLPSWYAPLKLPSSIPPKLSDVHALPIPQNQ